MPKQAGPDFILESNPDGPALTEKELKALAENDELQAHQDARVWWVKQKQDNVQLAGMVESVANDVDDIIEEVAAARQTERGGRADDKRGETAMEDRKKEGYF